jgi:AcrR family transcriptional regulator
VARWEPNALERLSQAAMELFVERGYARTTVEDIAERAGLTERTFFRYFTDKREVLFSGSSELERLIIDAVAGAPAAAAPLDIVVAALEATDAMFAERRAFARRRSALVAAHGDLQERELIKLAKLAASIATSLRKRGIAEPAASLAAEAGIAIFKIAFERWVGDAKHGLAHHIRAGRDALEVVTSRAKRPRSRSGR